MASAKIIRFPKTPRRRPSAVPQYAFSSSHRSGCQSGGFRVLWMASVAAIFLYLSGLAGVARDDRFYTGLLAAVWGFYFIYPPLLKVCVLGPLLMLAGRFLLLAVVVGFFGGVYWIILRNG